jgi:hypothetical protein
VLTAKTAKFQAGEVQFMSRTGAGFVTGHVDAEVPGWLSFAGLVLSEGLVVSLAARPQGEGGG